MSPNFSSKTEKSNLNRYAIKLAYIGKFYHGFQRQKRAVKTIEGTILDILTDLNIIPKNQKIRYSAAGRTDAGVNALAQVIAFDSERNKIHLEELNQNFPEDIYAWGITKVPAEFNARREAVNRSYKYFSRYKNEDLILMKKGLSKLIGTHNFLKFCKKSDKLPSGIEKSTILTLEEADVSYNDAKEILIFNFKSRSFLWKQVRKMVSMILDIGNQKYPVEIIDYALDIESGEPKGGIKPVSPEGLVLFDVEYSNIDFKTDFNNQQINARINTKLDTLTSSLEIMKLFEKMIL